MSALQTSPIPTVTVVGDLVTVSADIAWVDLASNPSAVVVPIETVQGVTLTGSTLLASSDGKAPVAWRLPPGSYKVTALGYPPNRMIPVRSEIVLDVVVNPPTRQQEINEAFRAFTIAKGDMAEALAALNTLKPTKAELKTAALAQ